MALDLYEHNANAYMAAYEMMDKYGKAAIVHRVFLELPPDIGQRFVVQLHRRESLRLPVQ